MKRSFGSTTLGSIGLAALVLATSGCGTTKARTQVQRAPWISFKGAKTVGLDLKAECTDLWILPTKGERKLHEEASEGGGSVGGVGVVGQSLLRVSTTERVREEADCSGTPFAQRALAQVRQTLRGRLASQGYQVVDGPADRSLSATLRSYRSRDLEAWGRQRDSKKDTACQQTCGRSECIKFRWLASASLKGDFAGPDMPPGEPQTVDRAIEHNALRAPGGQTEITFLGCDAAAEVPRLRDEGKYDFDGAMAANLKWLADSSQYMLTPYREDYDVVLFDSVNGAPTLEVGLAAAKAKKWSVAAATFQRDLEKLPATAEPKDRARLLHNLAASLMSAGKVDQARAKANEAVSLVDDADMRNLAREIQRRIVDAKK